jgi:hypothetical protein
MPGRRGLDHQGRGHERDDHGRGGPDLRGAFACGLYDHSGNGSSGNVDGRPEQHRSEGYITHAEHHGVIPELPGRGGVSDERAGHRGRLGVGPCRRVY